MDEPSSPSFGRKEKKPEHQEAWRPPLQIVSLRDSLVSALHPDLASPGNWARLICLPRNPHTCGSSPSGALPHLCGTLPHVGEMLQVPFPSDTPPASPHLLPGSLLTVSLYCKHSARADEAPYPVCQNPARSVMMSAGTKSAVPATYFESSGS